MIFKNLQNQFFFCLVLISATLFFGVRVVYSQEFTSPSYKVLDPVMNAGGYGSSASFNLLGVISQIANGTSTSGSFGDNAGFLYFPTATSPVVSATPGNAQIVLNWTAATGILANITSYDVGVSTSSGGTYTFTSIGNVLTYTKTGLTNSTPYFFKIRSYAGGLLLSESAEVSATPVALVTPPGGGDGGGDGGGTPPPPPPPPASNATTFSGRAYPGSTVILLKDGQVLVSTVAGDDANFFINVNGLTAGSYIFSVYSEDNQGNRSPFLTFPITLTAGASTNIGGIFLAPTLSADKTQVKKGDNITFFGQSAPTSEITISIGSAQEIFKKTNSDNNGVYLQVVDSSVLDLGDHSAKSKAAKDGQISSYSRAFAFAVGNTNLAIDNTKKCPTKGDLNNDCKVNLVDFSIAAFWYNKPLNAQVKIIEKDKLNGDGKINLVDFSIMAYYWTG